MTDNKIIKYDEEFIKKFEALKAVLEAEDRPSVYQFLRENFQFIFEMNQSYMKMAGEGVKDFEEADAEMQRELMRPLSHRQVRIIERSFSIWDFEREHVIWTPWDFLHDNGRIYEKKVMSPAEVSGFSMTLENAYRVLDTGRKE